MVSHALLKRGLADAGVRISPHLLRPIWVCVVLCADSTITSGLPPPFSCRAGAPRRHRLLTCAAGTCLELERSRPQVASSSPSTTFAAPAARCSRPWPIANPPSTRACSCLPIRRCTPILSMIGCAFSSVAGIGADSQGSLPYSTLRPSPGATPMRTSPASGSPTSTLSLDTPPSSSIPTVPAPSRLPRRRRTSASSP